MGKEGSLMASGLAETYGKAVELRMIDPMLLMRTKGYYYCLGAEKLK